MVSYIKKSEFILRYLIMWSVYTALYALAIYYVVPISFTIILLESTTHTIILFALLFFQWNFIRYSRHSEDTTATITYILLIIASIAIWIGLGYLANMALIGDEYTRALSYSIPIKVITGILASIIAVLHSISDKEKRMKNEEEKAEERLFFNNTPESTTIQEEERSIAEVISMEEIERVSVKTGGKITIIQISDIVYIQSYGDYVYLVTDSGKFIKERTMKYFESGLPNSSFIRIHRSYIVNITKISRVELSEKQTQRIIMTNGDKLKISTTGYKTLRRFLNI